AALCPRVAIDSANGAMGRGVSSTVSDTGAGPRGNRRWLLRGVLGAGAARAVGIPARRLLAPAAAAQPVTVGGLAVTCNLTLPIACAANEAANPFDPDGSGQLAFGFARYTGWPELKESLMAGD